MAKKPSSGEHKCPCLFAIGLGCLPRKAGFVVGNHAVEVTILFDRIRYGIVEVANGNIRVRVNNALRPILEVNRNRVTVGQT